METTSEIVLVQYENGTLKLLPDKNPVEYSSDTMFCDLCDYRTTKRKLLIQHMTSNHFSADRECKICGKRLNKMQLRLHMRFHDLKFVCDYCGKRFGDSKALKNHKNSRFCGEKLQETLSTKNFKCDFCEYRTHTQKLLMTHFRTLHVPKDHQCKTCNKEMTAKQYYAHKNYCNQESISCDFCGKKFSSQKYFKTHCRQKHPEKVLEAPSKLENVEEIHEKTRNEETLTYEIVPDKSENLQIEADENFLVEEIVEEEENIAEEYTEIETIDETEENLFEIPETVIQYQCTICSLSIPNIDELVKHMNDCHNDVNSECPLCQKLFTAQGLQRHMRYHEKNNICTKCGHEFAEIWQLKAHLDRKTSCLGPKIEDLQQDPSYMLKEFPCEHCLYRGASKNHLSRHMRNNHFDTPKDIECPDCGKILSKLKWQAHKKTHLKVKCDICQKIFTNSKFFKTHMENHANPKEITTKIPDKPTEKGFECPECGFITKERRFLVQHMKVNHAPKDFECEFEECKGKKFTKTQLRLHRRFHTLAFKCEKCGIGFPDNRDLKRHLNGKKCGQERKLRMTAEKAKTTKKVKIELKNDEILVEEVLNPPQIEEISPEEPIQEPSVQIEVHPLMNSTPNDMGIFECDNCNFEIDDKDELMEHWNQFHAPRDQPCLEPQCKGKLFSKAQLKIHMKFHQKTEMKPKITKTKKNRLKIVMDGDFPENLEENSWVYSCNECEFVTSEKEIFDVHRKKKHKKQQEQVKRVFECNECDFETNKEIYLQQHVQMNHES